MITALFTHFRLKFKIKYTEILSHDRLQSALKSISSRFNSNLVKMTASHSSKEKYYTFLQKFDKGTLPLRPGGSQATGSKTTVWLLIHFKYPVKTHMYALANSHLYS